MKKIVSIITGIVVSFGIFGAAFAYANNMPDNLISNETTENEIAEINYDDLDIGINQIETFTLNVNELVLFANDKKADKSGSISTNNSDKDYKYENKYGTFTFKTSNDKIKKYKYNDSDISEKYLIKGTAKFSKKDITFDGYFLVNNTLSGNKKGQVSMYNGKLTFPNGDKFDGYLTSGKYYYSGTYTWKNGQSYTGKFTKSNNIGTTALPENKMSEYGKFYFDSSKKTYLQIRFVEGIPQEAGYYVKSGNKYLVVFKKGVCTSTSISEK